MNLREELKKRDAFETPEQEAFLNVLRTQGMLSGALADLLKAHGTSPPLYNVLRILRGAGGEGLPCLEIAERMITRVPDITRLVDRLEETELAERQRTSQDRRVVLVKITSAGEQLLARLDKPIAELHVRLLGHLSPAELEQISSLMVKAREPLALPADLSGES